MRCVCECDCVYSRPILPEGKLIQSANNKQCITCRIPLTMAKCIRSTYCVCVRGCMLLYILWRAAVLIVNSWILKSFTRLSTFSHFFLFPHFSRFVLIFIFIQKRCGLMVFLDCVWFYFFSSLQLSFAHLTKLIYTKESARQRQCRVRVWKHRRFLSVCIIYSLQFFLSRVVVNSTRVMNLNFHA